MCHTLNHMIVPKNMPDRIQIARLVSPFSSRKSALGPNPTPGVYM